MEATNKFEDGTSAIEMVAKYTTAETDNKKKKLMIFERERSEIDEYLQAVDCMIQRFRRNASLESAETVRKQLLDEFGSILTHAFAPANSFSVSANYSISVSTNSLSTGELAGTLIADLRSIAQRLSAMGHLEDCRQLYKAKRLAFFDASLRRFGIQKSISAVEVKRMEWEALDKAVGLWLAAIKFFCVDLFPIERHTHDSIFKLDDNHVHVHGDAAAAALVMGIVRAYVSPFLDFTQAIASSHPSPQKLFRMLDLHHILKMTLHPRVLSGVPRDDLLVTQEEQVLSQLKEAAKMCFQNFESAVQSDITHISSVQEGVHTTTKYVMDYMTKLISEYGDDEREWIVSKPRKVEVCTRINGNLFEKNTIDGSSGLSPFASHVIWVIALLLSTLKTKIKQQLEDDDDAFANFFTMNNLNHVVQKVNRQPRLRQINGGDFQRDLETGLRASKRKYLRSSWIKIVQDLEQSSSTTTPRKIKLFNMMISRKGTLRTSIKCSINFIRLNLGGRPAMPSS